MKKVVASFAAFLLVFSIPVLFAQMPLGVPTVPGITSQDLTRIGVVAAAAGKVELTTPGQVGRVAQSGQAIFMGDEVKTDAQGHLQILLLDETVFTIGPNSAIIIDKFVYDPASHRGEIKASITKGVFRYVSGKIAASDPDSVKVKLPAATLGFRGTIVGGSVGANGEGIAALMGPGSNNDAGAQNGSFTIDGAGGDQQHVNRTGFGVEFGADGGLSGVFQLSGEQINGLSAGLGGGQGSGDQGGGNQGGDDSGGGLGGSTDMGDLSGENNVLAGGNVALVDGLDSISDSLNNASILGAQESRNDSGGVPNGPTTYEQLQAASGSGHYASNGSYSGGGGGTMFAQAGILFGFGGYIGGGNSLVSVSDGVYTDQANLGNSGTQFTGSGPASFSWNVTAASGGIFGVTATLSNVDGVTAQEALVKVSYSPNTCTGGCPVSGTGTATAALSPGII